MQYQILKTADQIQTALAYLMQAKAVGFDLETTSLDPRHGKIRLLQFSDGEKHFIIDTFKLDNPKSLNLLTPFLESSKPRKIIHNSKFEHGWIEHHLGCEINGVFDTYLSAKLIDMFRDQKLDEVIFTYLKEEISKDQQKSDWSAPELSPAQYEYAVKDVSFLPRLRKEIIDKLYQENLIEVSEIEFNCAPATSQIENSGIALDSKLYSKLIEDWEAQKLLKEASLKELLGNALASTEEDTQGNLFGESLQIKEEINLNSHMQVKKAFAALGVDLPSTNKDIISKLLPKHPELQYLTEYRKVEKLLTTYGWSLLNGLDSITGRLHASFWQLGTETGRFSSTKPNLQNLPATEEVRGCFKVKEGRKLIIADYSQIELRILTQFSHDINMTRAYREGIDLHSMTAKGAFNLDCTIEQVKDLYDKYRKLAKGLNFGVVYGIGAAKYANNTGIPLREAETAIKNFNKTYQQADEWLRAMEITGVSARKVRTMSNRIIRLNFDPNDGKAVSLAKRNSRNSPIQGTSGDILKIALHLIKKGLKGYNAFLCNTVHDEILVECDADEANDVAYIVENSMVMAGKRYITSIPIEAKPVIADSWSEK